jgi:hypothetical protein
VDRDTQRARIKHRQARAPHQTFPISQAEADRDRWREPFEFPDAAALSGTALDAPPAGCSEWPRWAARRWPSSAQSPAW